MKKKIEESPERAEYRQKCKHYGLCSGQCYKYSETAGGWHLNIHCDGKCTRMKNYDKRHENSRIKGY